MKYKKLETSVVRNSIYDQETYEKLQERIFNYNPSKQYVNEVINIYFTIKEEVRG